MTNKRLAELTEQFTKNISQMSDEEFKAVLKEYENGDIAKLLARAKPTQLITQPGSPPDSA